MTKKKLGVGSRCLLLPALSKNHPSFYDTDKKTPERIKTVVHILESALKKKDVEMWKKVVEIQKIF